jgi:glycosyltransferase involved in cell wall biosynthesis
MKLSLIIAIYNIEDYVEDCIKSIIQQDLTDCEVLLIDDGATDNCATICKKYINSNIKYLYKENGGLGSARNFGLKHAQGEYIWFIDGDDEIDKHAIETLLNALKTFNSEIVMFYTLHKRLKEQNLRLESDMLYLENYEILDFIKAVNSFPVAVWSFIFNKEFLLRHNLLFDDNMHHEDNHFMYRVLNKAQRISSLNKALYIYKAREGSIMKRDVSKKKIDSLYKIIELLADLQPETLTDLILKNKLFFHLQEYIFLSSNFTDNNWERLFKKVPKQKIFLKDPYGIIMEKLLYNFSKKLYVKRILSNFNKSISA